MKQLGIGIIGFGRIGAEHAGWIARSGAARVVAVADPTQPRRTIAEKSGFRCSASHEPLLRDPEVDAVLISTPTAMHCPQTIDALDAGKHVMVEKPFTMNLDEARNLVRRARERERILSVFHNRRWDLDYLTLKNAVDAGIFGKLINVESRIGQWASCVGPAAREWRPNWRNEAAFGGGGLYDWGSHFVDQMWRLLWPARPVRVYGELRGNVWSRDCDDFARVSIDFDNGAVGLVEINTTTTRPLPRWHVDGDNGSAESPHSLDFDVHTWSQFSFQSPDASSSTSLPIAPPGLNEVQIWQRFAAACAGEGDPAVRAASVLPTMALLDAARESSQSGRLIDVADRVEWML